MRCKQCQTEISIEVAGETTRNIKRYCEVVGMAPEAAASFASQRGPLCRECMQQWDSRVDDERAGSERAGSVASPPSGTAGPN